MGDMLTVDSVLFFIGLLSIFVSGITLLIIPYINRKSLLFGVRIPESAATDPAVQAMRMKYTIEMGLCLLFTLAIAILLFAFFPDAAILTILYFPIALIMAQFAVYLPLYRKSVRLKAERGWQTSYIGVSYTGSRKERIRSIPRIWYFLSLLLVVASVIYGIVMYPAIPTRLITHWNAAMQADAWSDKSLLTVFIMPMVSLGLILLFFFSNVLMAVMKLQISPERPALSLEQNRKYRRIMGHMMGYMSLLCTLFFALMMPMTMNLYIPSAQIMTGAITLFTGLMIVPPLLITIRVGQGGSKLRENSSPVDGREDSVAKEAQTTQRGDDKFWKLGMFYWNPDDPNLFVEDRFGSSGGLNYAHPLSFVLAAVLLLVTIIIYIGVTALYFQGVFSR